MQGEGGIKNRIVPAAASRNTRETRVLVRREQNTGCPGNTITWPFLVSHYATHTTSLSSFSCTTSCPKKQCGGTKAFNLPLDTRHQHSLIYRQVMWKGLASAALATLAATAVKAASYDDIPDIEVYGQHFFYSNNGSQLYVGGLQKTRLIANNTHQLSQGCCVPAELLSQWLHQRKHHILGSACRR